MMDRAMHHRRVQQDAEVRLHLLGDTGVHRKGGGAGSRKSGDQGHGQGRGGEDRARATAHQWLLPTSAGGAWDGSEGGGPASV